METCILKLSVVFLKAHYFAVQENRAFTLRTLCWQPLAPDNFMASSKLQAKVLRPRPMYPLQNGVTPAWSLGAPCYDPHLGQSWSAPRALPAICSCPSSVSCPIEMPWQKKTKAERVYLAPGSRPLFTVVGKSSGQESHIHSQEREETRMIALGSLSPGFPA